MNKRSRAKNAVYIYRVYTKSIHFDFDKLVQDQGFTILKHLSDPYKILGGKDIVSISLI